MSGPDWVAAIFLWFQFDATHFFMPALFAGLITAWAMISPIPAILLSAGDEQSCLMTTPGQTLARNGHGLAAIKLVGRGSLIGLLILAILLPLAAPFLVTLHHALAPHLGWILWSAILFLALSERPRAAPTAFPFWYHIAYTMTPVWAGLATLLLSGLLGQLIFFRSPIPLTSSILNFIPAIIGLFTVPGLLMHIVLPSPAYKLGISQNGTNRPCQTSPGEVHLFQAITCATLSGIVTVLIPALTGSMSALWTQHLVGSRQAGTQLVAQGINRMLYYGGGLMLLFLPGVPRMRSSSAALLHTFYEPSPAQVWWMAIVIGLSALAAWLLISPCSKCLLETIERYGTRPPATIALAGIGILVAVTTHWQGLVVLLTATSIGMIPILFQSRPIQGIGVVLIPLAFALTR